MIRPFKCPDTERLANDERTGGRRKLALLDTATSLSDLLSPPGNRLEKLTGDRDGQHSVRVNDGGRHEQEITTGASRRDSA